MERTMSGPTVFEAFTVVDTNLAALQERVDQKIWRQRLAGETVDPYQSGYRDAIVACRRQLGLT